MKTHGSVIAVGCVHLHVRSTAGAGRQRARLAALLLSALRLTWLRS